MKKLLYLIAAVIFVSGSAFADFNGPSVYPAGPGFNGGVNYSVSSIKDVMGMYDDQIAVIQGNIVQRLSDDKFLFIDKTGEMVVEIDYKYWGGLQVDEKNILELTGKVDKDYNSVSLDLFMVKKIK